jgi:flagella basal body P-ring formation protein FlgA
MTISRKKPAILMALMMGAALWLAPSAGMAAGIGMEPVSFAKISGAHVTLKDVFPHVTREADFILAPAPKMGEDLILTSADLLRISSNFNLGWRPEAGAVKQTVITSVQTDVQKDEIAEVIKDGLLAELGLNDLEVELETKKNFYVQGEAAPKIILKALTLDRAQNRFEATVAMMDTATARERRVDVVVGRFYALVEVPVLNRNISAHEIIGAMDVDYVPMRQTMINTKTLVNSDALIGKSPRRSLLAQRPLMVNDVSEPRLIKKGELVTLTFETPIMRLTAQGKALSDGIKGKTIRIVNTESNKIVEGIVTGAQEVAIMPSARL